MSNCIGCDWLKVQAALGSHHPSSNQILLGLTNFNRKSLMPKAVVYGVANIFLDEFLQYNSKLPLAILSFFFV